MLDFEPKILASDLPFCPTRGQVIYVDSNNDKRINSFIVKNYDWLRRTFSKSRLDFCYLPLLGEQVLAYHAPYLDSEQRQQLLINVPTITSFIKGEDCESLQPSLLYALNDEGDGEMRLVPIETRWFDRLKNVFTTLAKNIQHDLASHYVPPRREEQAQTVGLSVETDSGAQPHEGTTNGSDVRFSLSVEPISGVQPHEEATKWSDIRFRIIEEDELDNYDFDPESEVLVSEIRERIKALINKGVNTMFLHNIIDEGKHLSSLHITKDYRIFLPDYGNMEITLPALPKAVFILFLKHPEGLRFKDLVDHYDELFNIYRVLNPIGGSQRQRQSIQEITSPLSNSINEKCARIKEAFIKHFDERLAQNYYITGKRGEPKRIALSPSLIVWEQ